MLDTLMKIRATVEAIYLLLEARVPDGQASSGQEGDTDKISLQEHKLLDVQQVLTILGIGRTTYYRFVKDGKLVPRKIGERHCYYYADLDQMILESKRRGRI